MVTSTSLFDRVGGLLGRRRVLDQMCRTIEEDRSTTRRLSMEAVAVLIAGSARQLSSGDDAVNDALADVDLSLLEVDDPIKLINPAAGNQRVAGLLGDKWSVYAEGLAEINGVEVHQVQSVLSCVAPVLVAAVKEQQEIGGLDQTQLVEVLRLERDRVAGLGMLSWAPHAVQTPMTPSRPILDSSRNVVKRRGDHVASEPVVTDLVDEPVKRRQPMWLWWSLAVVFIVLTVGWILSQAV